MQLSRKITVRRGMRTPALVVVSLTFGACGLRGPLYLPDERKEEVSAPSSTPQTPTKRRTPFPPAPQSQKKDREQEIPAAGATPSAPTASPPDPDRPATPPPPAEPK